MFGQKASVGGGASVDLLNTAAARFDPETFVGANPATAWLSRGNLGHDFDLDVVVGTGANLSLLDTGVALLRGASGDTFSTDDQPNPTNLQIVAWSAPLSWTSSGNKTIFGHQGGGGNGGFFINIEANTGKLALFTSSDGSALVDSKSSVATGFSAGTGHWVKITWSPATDKANYFTSNQDKTTALGDLVFSRLGNADIPHVDGPLFNNNIVFEVGSINVGTGNIWPGQAKRVVLYDDIGGSPLIDFDPSRFAVNSSTAVMATGETWTASGNAFVNATGHTGLYSRGSVGLETTAGQLLTSPVTVYAVFRPTLASPGDDQRVFDSRSDVNARMMLQTTDSVSDKWGFFQGTSVLTLAQSFNTKLRILTVQFLGTASSKLTVSDEGSVTGDGGSHNWDFGSIFMNFGGALTMQGLFLELDIFKGAHSAAQILEMQNYLGGKYA